MKYLRYRLLRPVLINLFLPLLIFSVTESYGQSRGLLLALSKTNHTLAIVDPVSLNVLARVPVGSDPHEVIASSDGNDDDPTGFGRVFPRCRVCKEGARPSVCMFGDSSWLQDEIPGFYYFGWSKIIKKILKKEKSKKIVIIEIGCGNRVTTIRNFQRNGEDLVLLVLLLW